MSNCWEIGLLVLWKLYLRLNEWSMALNLGELMRQLNLRNERMLARKKIEVHMWLIILISQKATKNIIEGHFPLFDSK